MYTYDSRIAYSETDADGFLTPEALVDYFQNCSTFQTQDGPVPMEELRRRGILWVINAWQIDIHRLPYLGEYVTVGTVPYEMKGFIGLRNFFLDTADHQERLAVANTTWSLIDIEQGRPVRVTQDICDAYPLDPQLEMENLPRKIKLPASGGEVTASFAVSVHHLDSNYHVNNGQYIRMALDIAREQGALDGRNTSLMRIRADYRAQARLGNEICPMVYTQQNEEQTMVTVALNDTEGNPYTLVELWQRGMG